MELSLPATKRQYKWGGVMVVIIQNDSPERMRIVFSGPISALKNSEHDSARLIPGQGRCIAQSWAQLDGIRCNRGNMMWSYSLSRIRA